MSTALLQGVAVEFDAPVPMRDGTVLRANVFRPEGSGSWPVLLNRTPYGKDLPAANLVLDAVQAARRGYLVIVQDTRGRFNSGGEYEPFRNEAEPQGPSNVPMSPLERLSGDTARHGHRGPNLARGLSGRAG